MKYIEPDQSPHIANVRIPEELYWILSDPPLAGMQFPLKLSWQELHNVGFTDVVSLHPDGYDPSPLSLCFSKELQDLYGGRTPTNPEREKDLVREAVEAVVKSLSSKRGVVVHCLGGRGRTGTVLGCTLREFGFGAQDVIAYLDRIHKARGTEGWPESRWQSDLILNWKNT